MTDPTGADRPYAERRPPIVVTGYADLTLIGHGGLGDVYHATQVATGREVAVKVLRDVADATRAWHRVRRELTALSALTGHAHVVDPIEVLDLASGPALVMEYCPGGSVGDLLADPLAERGGRAAGEPATLSAAQAVLVGRHTAAALVAAHARGIVHRDIKPHNLLIDAAGQVKLCDFGIAALTADPDYRTRTNAISMRYASPEDLEQDELVGPASDVYSLGATLVHLVHGSPPSLRERLVAWTPPPDGDAATAALDRVIARCLQPVANRRPDAQQLLDSLDGLALGAGYARVEALPVLRRHAPAGARPVAAVPVEPVADEHHAQPVPEHPGGADRGRGGDRHLHVDTRIDRSHADRAPMGATPAVARLGSDVEVVRPQPPATAWWAWPVVVLAVAAVVALAVVVFRGPGDDPDPPTGSATTTAADAAAPASGAAAPASVPTVAVPVTAPRPDGVPSLLTTDWSVGATGDCLVQPSPPAAGAALEVVGCGEPHDLQRYAGGDIAAPQLGEFDDDRIDELVVSICRSAFPGFVGSNPASSRLSIAHSRPDAAAWAAGDRGYVCVLGIDGVRLVGDARTSGW